MRKYSLSSVGVSSMPPWCERVYGAGVDPSPGPRIRACPLPSERNLKFSKCAPSPFPRHYPVSFIDRIAGGREGIFSESRRFSSVPLR
jgi:hypothetical protein